MRLANSSPLPWGSAMKDRDEIILRAGLILRRMEQIAQRMDVDTPQNLRDEWRKLEVRWRLLMQQIRDSLPNGEA